MNNNIPIEEIYKLIKEIGSSDQITQRAIAKRLGYSIGKVNYIIKSLVEKGFIKLENFKNNKNKLAYKYILTQKGLAEKYKIAKEFLRRKETEYIVMKEEIELLRKEIGPQDKFEFFGKVNF